MRRKIFESEHEIFRDAFRAFLNKEVVPRRESFLNQGFVSKDVWLKAGEAGFLIPSAAESLGGLGLKDFRFEQIMAEEVGLCGESGFIPFLHNVIAAPYISRYGGPALQKECIPRAVSGEAIMGIALTEPNIGSDLAGMRTTAKVMNGYYLLNGTKTYISNGTIGSIFVVAARTGGQGKDGISLLAVEDRWDGFERGKPLKKMGMRSQDTAELIFDNVKVPKENLIGEAGRGFSYLMRGLAEERTIVAIWNHASAECAFRETLAYIKGRNVFGRPISSHQNTQFVMAGLRAELDIAQAFLDALVVDINDGNIDPVAASVAKLTCSELQGEVVDSCMQFFGGAGYMDEYPISRLYADARVTRIFAGTSEIMKMIIAKSMEL